MVEQNGAEIESETYIMEQFCKKEKLEREYGIPEIGYLRHHLWGYKFMDTANVGEGWDIFNEEEYKITT